jgi:D-serine deaminase-like pyridoxal phosphate-dependent protein
VVDTGYHRFGIDGANAAEFTQRIANLPGVVVTGIRSHAGHVYDLRDASARAAVTAAEIGVMSAVADEVRERGLECPIVSIGSTPAARSIFEAGDLGLVTEARPGNYVFFDRIMVSLGVCSLEECALRVICEVVASHRGTSLLDGGKLTFSSTADPFSTGYGAILGHPNTVIETLSQECASVSTRFSVGERLVVVPNHACEITNLAPAVFYGRDDRIEGVWPVDARARVW